MCTVEVTAAISTSPVSDSTTAMPVVTPWSLPRRRRSISTASLRVTGLPSIAPSTTTTVSAPRTTPRPTLVATDEALRRAIRVAYCSARSPSSGESSVTSESTTSNSSPADSRISRLRGELDASTSRPSLPAQPILRPPASVSRRTRRGRSAGTCPPVRLTRPRSPTSP